MDGDGDGDLITTGSDTNSQIYTIIYRNDDGIYTEVSSIFENVQDADVAIVDYDNDGNNDVAIIGEQGSYLISNLYKNNGNFLFTEVSTTFDPSNSGSISSADINNDGYMDLVIMGATMGSPILNIYMNNTDGTFSLSQSLPGLSFGEATFGDVDNDGDIDLFAVGRITNGTKYARLYTNDGTGMMTLNRSFNPGLTKAAAVLVDINNDGYLDILYAGDFSVTPFSDARIKLFMNGTLGVDDVNVNAFTIYPNPTRDVVNVDLPADIYDVSVTLTDMTGRNIPILFTNDHFDISNLSAGIYLVTMQSGTVSVTQRIVKQ